MPKQYSNVLTSFLSVLVVSACNDNSAMKTVEPTLSPQASEVAPAPKAKEEMKDKATIAIEQALENADFRLLHSKGRRLVVPGLESIEISILEAKCGLKPMLNSSDVIKTAEQRQQQKNQYAFAKKYNQSVYAACLKSVVKKRG